MLHIQLKLLTMFTLIVISKSGSSMPDVYQTANATSRHVATANGRNNVNVSSPGNHHFLERPSSASLYFRMDNVSMEECAALDTKNCLISSQSENCTSGYFRVVCEENGTNNEIRFSLEKISLLKKDRPVSVKLVGSRKLIRSLIPSRNPLIISLVIFQNNEFVVSSLQMFDIPNLIELKILDCQNLHILKGNLDGFAKLQVLVFSRFSLTMIEDGSFDNFGSLQQLSLEELASSSELDTASAQQIYKSWEFHCACKYLWLRNYFLRYPHVLSAKKRGEIYSVGGFENMSSIALFSATYTCVDCADSALFRYIPMDPPTFSINNTNHCYLKHNGFVGSNTLNNNSAHFLLLPNTGETRVNPLVRNKTNQNQLMRHEMHENVSYVKKPTFSLGKHQLPFFSGKEMSLDECRRLDTTNCIVSSNSKDCTGRFLNVICSEYATNMEIHASMENIKLINRNRPVDVLLKGQFTVNAQLLLPAKNDILSLHFFNNSQLCLSQLRHLDLPNLATLKIQNGKNLELKKVDLDGFEKLRILSFVYCTFITIEEGAFDNLVTLRLLVLLESLNQQGAPSCQSHPTVVRFHLYQLHCDCDFAWLRKFFRQRPYLLSERSSNELYSVRDYGNVEHGRSSIFVPVDCAKPDLIGSENQTDFSVNDNCATNALRNETLLEPIVDEEPYSDAVLASADHIESHFVYPVLLSSCTIGNGLALFVLIHEQPKTRTTVYLMIVSISDLLYIWLMLPQYTYFYYLETENITSTIFVSGYAQTMGLRIWSKQTCMHLSNWIILVFSFERLLAVAKPLVFREGAEWDLHHKLKFAWSTGGILLVLSATSQIFHLVHYYRFTYTFLVIPSLEKPQWLISWMCYQKKGEIVISLMNFLVLLIVNTVIVVKLTRRRMARTMTATVFLKESKKRRQLEINKCNLLLLGSSALFVTTQLPGVIDTCLFVVTKYLYDYPVSSQAYVKHFVAMFRHVNYSANCYVYLLVSSRFRQQCFNVVRKYSRS